MQQGDELRQCLRGIAPQLAAAGAFSGAINLLYLSSPLYLMQVYNRVLASESGTTLIMLTLILAFALAAMAVLDTARTQVLVRCGIAFDRILSARIFDALIVRAARLGPAGSAQPLRDFDQFRSFVTGPGIHFLFDLPWMPIYLAVLFLIHPLLGLLSTAGAALLLGFAVLNEVMTRRSLQISDQAGTRSYVLTDNLLRHADVVQAMGLHEGVRARWQGSRDGMLGHQAAASDWNAIFSSATRCFRLLLQSLMLGAGAWLAINHAIMPATIFAASVVMGRALVPVEQAVAVWRQFASARQGYQRVQDLLATTPAAVARSVMPRNGASLSVAGLTYFAPPRPTPVLNEISFQLEQGMALGVVGPSGSGKSTLARLIAGAMPPSAGSLSFGGIDYDLWDRSEFGRQIGYLPQDIGLFPGSIADNIARFSDATMDEIVEAARLAGIHEMILQMPNGYDGLVGPGGHGLSGGQRQRVALARALIGRPPLLVLDEPNSNLDGDGEAALKNAITTLRGYGSTVVVITHRPSALSVVDRLMVIRAGTIATMGTPAEVLESLQPGLSAIQAATGRAA